VKNLGIGRLIAVFLILSTIHIGHGGLSAHELRQGDVKILVLRVYFPDEDLRIDYTDPLQTPRWTRDELRDLINDEINSLWENSSYGNVGVRAEISPDFMLDYRGKGPETFIGLANQTDIPPWPRALYQSPTKPKEYFDHSPMMDAAVLSAKKAYANMDENEKREWSAAMPTYWDSEQNDINWDNVDGLLVYIIQPPAAIDYLADTDNPSAVTWQGDTYENHFFNRMQAGPNNCGRNIGAPHRIRHIACGKLFEGLVRPGSWADNYSINLADRMATGMSRTEAWRSLLSEDPESIYTLDSTVWGAMAHEVGHMLQTPWDGSLSTAHPSAYQNKFELMDTLYPGLAGAFVRQSDQFFGNWLPDRSIYSMPLESAGAYISLSSLELGLGDPGLANHRAGKIPISESEYYLISVRKRINGDDLSGQTSYRPNGLGGLHWAAEPSGIPDEGVLIERVREAGYDTVVTETACPSIEDDFVLPAGGFCSFEVGLDPSSLGLKTATLSIKAQEGDRGEETTEISLKGVGVAGEARAAETGDTSVGGDVKVLPVKLEGVGPVFDFGEVNVDAPKASTGPAHTSKRLIEGIDFKSPSIQLALKNTTAEDRLIKSITLVGSNDFQLALDLEQQCPIGTGNKSSPCAPVRVIGGYEQNGKTYRNILWKEGDVFDSGSYIGTFRPGTDREIREGSRVWKDDGIRISISDATEDTYGIYITRTPTEEKADMMLRPWRSNPDPGTYETTDIWIDSPLNGYCGGGVEGENIRTPAPSLQDIARCMGHYTQGVRGDQNDPFYGTVVRSGDAPAVGMPNRVYARIRNQGDAPSENVSVIWEVQYKEDLPPGHNIGPGEWREIARISPEEDPRLARVLEDTQLDVYQYWTPSRDLFPEDLGAGDFQFHACIRVRLVVDEGNESIRNNHTVSGDSDLDLHREQENIDFFEIGVEREVENPVVRSYDRIITINNFDDELPQSLELYIESDLPEGWEVEVNDGAYTVHLEKGESRDIPVSIKPSGDLEVGESYRVDVSGHYQRTLVNELDEEDTHPERQTLGGVSIENRVLYQTQMSLDTVSQSESSLMIEGRLTGTDTIYDLGYAPTVMIVGVDNNDNYLLDSLTWLTLAQDGSFSGMLDVPFERLSDVSGVVGFFAGDMLHTSASTSYTEVVEEKQLIPKWYGDPGIGIGRAVTGPVVATDFPRFTVRTSKGDVELAVGSNTRISTAHEKDLGFDALIDENAIRVAVLTDTSPINEEGLLKTEVVTASKISIIPDKVTRTHERVIALEKKSDGSVQVITDKGVSARLRFSDPSTITIGDRMIAVLKKDDAASQKPEDAELRVLSEIKADVVSKRLKGFVEDNAGGSNELLTTLSNLQTRNHAFEIDRQVRLSIGTFERELKPLVQITIGTMRYAIAPVPGPGTSVVPTPLPTVAPTYVPAPLPTAVPTPLPTAIPTLVPTPGPVALPGKANNVIPHVFVGSVKVGGQAAPDGTQVSAWVSEFSSPVGEGTVSGGSYMMNISQYGIASFAGKTLTFKIGDDDTGQTSTWEKGGATVVDLTID
tara:strand:- start:2688 stop:7313 length:4626 start_codon:yes stop_codon:yes gene_type:complete